MKNNLFTYKKSGVNISSADKFVKFISNITSKKIEFWENKGPKNNLESTELNKKIFIIRI